MGTTIRPVFGRQGPIAAPFGAVMGPFTIVFASPLMATFT